jgi:Gram-negative bacterial TonB protein C-terminal
MPKTAFMFAIRRASRSRRQECFKPSPKPIAGALYYGFSQESYAVAPIVPSCAAFAQTDSHPETSRGKVVMVSFSNPIYPPLARTANISGDVELNLGIRSDGSIESVVAVSGNPILTQAALNSAQQSRFECQACEGQVTIYSLIYSFQIVAGPDFPCPEGNGLHVSRFQNRVTVVAEPALVHPYFSSFPVRSAKCLFLWLCGSRWGGEDYYYYRVRSARCLGLWNCGHVLREPFATCNRLHRTLS